MLRAVKLSALVAVGLVIAGRSGDLWAADPEAARQEAKQLSKRGSDAMERSDFAHALDDFRAAYDVYPSPNLLYNIGTALEQLGRYAEAVGVLEAFLGSAPNAPLANRAYASERLAELSKQIARVDIVVSPADAAVTIDGRRVPDVRLGGVPVMPGERLIVAEQEGYVSAVRHITIAAGERSGVVLTLQPQIVHFTRAPPEAALRPVPPPPVSQPLRTRRLRLAAWTTFAGALLSLAGGVVATGLRERYARLWNDDSQCLALGRTRYENCAGDYHAGTSAQTASIVLYSLSAALAVSSTALFVVEYRRRERRLAMQCTPGFGITCQLSF